MTPLLEPGGGPTERRQDAGGSQSTRSISPSEDYNTKEGLLHTEVWTEIEESLTNIKEGLEKEGVGLQYLDELASIIDCVSLASRQLPTGRMEAQLERIEKMLQQKATPPKQPSKQNSWASVAAAGLRQAGVSPALRQRHSVRVQLAKSKGKNNEEILKEVKKTIPGAAAIRVLRSGDIDITVPDEATKDRAYSLPSTEELKIYKKDYLVEAIGVPLSVRVACEKGGINAQKNAQLAAAICTASKSIAPGLQITRIRWLHKQEDISMQDACEKHTKTRGSLLIGFPTQEMQRRAIQGGLVIEAQLFETRPFEQALIATQCFNCQQWGHTQKACGRKARCGQCAGDHATRDCPKERISCANCGKRHRSWQRRECSSFRAYFEGIQRRRIALYTHASSMRNTGQWTPQSSSASSQGSDVLLGPRKRTRVASPSHEERQRRAGRPTNIEQAARDPSQSHLQFGQAFTDALRSNFNW